MHSLHASIGLRQHVVKGMDDICMCISESHWKIGESQSVCLHIDVFLFEEQTLILFMYVCCIDMYPIVRLMHECVPCPSDIHAASRFASKGRRAREG